MEKIVRSVCYFTREPDQNTVDKLDRIKSDLEREGYEVQTRRICSPDKGFTELKNMIDDDSIFLSVGSVEKLEGNVEDFIEAEDVAFNLDLTGREIEERHVDFLFRIIEESPSSTFSFCYAFNNPPSSPYHPPAAYAEEGFSIGLQPTNLSKGCETLEEWLESMKDCWEEIDSMFEERDDYLGIDSSVAPFSQGSGSMVNLVNRLGLSFSESVLTDNYLKVTEFIEQENPRPAGLCGLMVPCLEDFELAEEYEDGNFSIERNLFLSLHSGLGIDVYPIGVDESREKVLEILKTVQKLSSKHQKPLSIRFVSDGEAEIGEKTDFGNQYLKDVTVREL